MNRILMRWNQLSADEAADDILPCCGSRAWANEMTRLRPLPNEDSTIAASDRVWNQLHPEDWQEAFSKHPRIGERRAPEAASPRSASWSTQEQKNVALADDSVVEALAEVNREYEQRFGRVFIVCATGKSAAEMLEIAQRRLQNDPTAELREAAEEQRKITNIRLGKWLSQ